MRMLNAFILAISLFSLTSTAASPQSPIPKSSPSHNRQITQPTSIKLFNAASNSDQCQIDFSPINYQTVGSSSGIDYVSRGTMTLAKGDLISGRSTVEFSDISTLNIANPILQNLASNLNSQIYNAGKQNDSCNNSFGGSQVWLESSSPPRLKGKAGGTKRSCTCGTVPCPTWDKPFRTCDQCLVSDIASGEVQVGWRIDTRLEPQTSSVVFPIVLEYRNSSTSGGEIFNLLQGLGIVDIFDNIFRLNLDSAATNIGAALSASANTTGRIPLPEMPIRIQVKTVAWSAPNASNVQPYAVSMTRTFSLFEGTACVFSRCLRHYGMDGIIAGACPDL